MSWFSTQPANDIEKARLGLSFFHNSSIGLGNYNFSLDGLINTIAGGANKTTAFLEDFGFAINTIGMSVSQVQDAMESLANVSQGRIPTRTAFFQSLSSRISNPTFMDYVGVTPKVIGESAVDLAMGAKEIGDAFIDTGKSLLVLGPLAIVVAVGFILYARTRSIAGR